MSEQPISELLTTAWLSITSSIGGLAFSASKLSAYSRDLRRNPNDEVARGWAREQLNDAREALMKAVDAIDVAKTAIDAAEAPEPIHVAAAAASAVMAGVARGGGVHRLVPRMPVVKSSGAMGFVAPRGDGPEAA